MEVSLAAVAHVYAYLPLTAEIAMELNGETKLEKLAADIVEISYPCNEYR